MRQSNSNMKHPTAVWMDGWEKKGNLIVQKNQRFLCIQFPAKTTGCMFTCMCEMEIGTKIKAHRHEMGNAIRQRGPFIRFHDCVNTDWGWITPFHVTLLWKSSSKLNSSLLSLLLPGNKLYRIKTA